MFNINLTEKLSMAFGPSGFEEEVVELIIGELIDYNLEVDNFNNLYVNINKFDYNKKTVMLDAHTDEVGFIVQSIASNGLISFLKIGSIIDENLKAQKVIIRNELNHYITGIITSRPPHLIRSNDGSLIKNDSLYIDIGARTDIEVFEKFKVNIGDPIIPKVEFYSINENELLCSKAFDNRIGCFCLLELIKKIDRKDIDVNLVGSFTSQEEVGCRGAKISASKINPDFAIIFEGSPADDVYFDISNPQCVLNKGPQIRFFDSGMISNREMIKYANKIAMKHNIPIQKAVRYSGSTDASSIHLSNLGVPCLVLGIPTRYAHTHNSIVSVSDLNNTIELAYHILDEFSDFMLEFDKKYNAYKL